jgi:acyl-CoA thioesterase-1
MTLRRLIQLAIAAALIAVLVIWIRSRPQDYVNYPPTAAGPWVAFGDSLTLGVGASEGFDYPARLSRHLGITITNLGRSGETTMGGLQRVAEVTRLQPRVVLLCLGGNDSLNSEPTRQTFVNLATLIDRLHEHGAFVVLIGVHSASLRDRNEEHFARVAREKRVFYIPDILKGVLFKPVYMSDAIHPNDEGYKRIAERLAKELKPLLPRMQPQPAIP